MLRNNNKFEKNNFNFETMIYLKSRAERQAAKRYTTLNTPKMENNWKEKTIESLEKDVWGSPDGESYLIKTCHSLRKKQLKKFEIEDCRIMIGQNIGTKFVMPIALDFLDENILAEGDFYKGDLLKSIIEINESFWANNKELTDRLIQIIERQKNYLENEDKGLFRKSLKWKENVV